MSLAGPGWQAACTHPALALEGCIGTEKDWSGGCCTNAKLTNARARACHNFIHLD